MDGGLLTPYCTSDLTGALDQIEGRRYLLVNNRCGRTREGQETVWEPVFGMLTPLTQLIAAASDPRDQRARTYACYVRNHGNIGSSMDPHRGSIHFRIFRILVLAQHASVRHMFFNWLFKSLYLSISMAQLIHHPNTASLRSSEKSPS